MGSYYSFEGLAVSPYFMGFYFFAVSVRYSGILPIFLYEFSVVIYITLSVFFGTLVSVFYLGGTDAPMVRPGHAGWGFHGPAVHSL